MDADDRQLAELTSQEEWERRTSPGFLLGKMQLDVERGSVLQRILRAERLAANRDTNELERKDVVNSKG